MFMQLQYGILEAVYVQKEPQYSGVYYENQGSLKITNNEWKLITYYNLSNYLETINSMETIMLRSWNVCRYMMEKNIKENIKLCDIMQNQVNEIKLKTDLRRDAILGSIGYQEIEIQNFRRKRSLGKIIKYAEKAAHVLYGLCDKSCTNENTQYVHELNTQGSTQLQKLDQRIQIIKMGINSIDSVVGILEKNIDNITEELDNLARRVMQMENTTNTTGSKEPIYEAFLYLNNALQQYNFDTEIISEIIHTAQEGLVHPSILSPKELMEHLKGIKVNLPKGTDLPMGLSITEAYETLKMSKVTIYSQNKTIVFIIEIPIVEHHELTLYNLIPLPVHYKNNKYIYIKPNFDYIAVTSSREHYTTFNEIQILQCKVTKDFLLCPQFQPLQPKTINPICEIELMLQPDVTPPDCRIMYFELGTSLFHKLKYKNTWIFMVIKETVLITCQNETDSSIQLLQEVGIINIPVNCRAHSSHNILIPGNNLVTTIGNDFVPTTDIRKNVHLDKMENPRFKMGKFTEKQKTDNRVNEIFKISESLNDLPYKIQNADSEEGTHNEEVIKTVLIYISVIAIIMIGIYETIPCARGVIRKYQSKNENTESNNNNNNRTTRDDVVYDAIPVNAQPLRRGFGQIYSSMTSF